MRERTTMGIVRTTLLGCAALAVAVWVSASLIADGHLTGQAPHQMPKPGKNMMTKEQKLANAMTAAPAASSGKATILDWPAKEEDQPAVLRAGSNGRH